MNGDLNGLRKEAVWEMRVNDFIAEVVERNRLYWQ